MSKKEEIRYSPAEKARQLSILGVQFPIGTYPKRKYPAVHALYPLIRGIELQHKMLPSAKIEILHYTTKQIILSNKILPESYGVLRNKIKYFKEYEDSGSLIFDEEYKTLIRQLADAEEGIDINSPSYEVGKVIKLGPASTINIVSSEVRELINKWKWNDEFYTDEDTDPKPDTKGKS